MSMEFRGLRAGKKKKQRLIKRENTQLVEEPFRCVILGDKMSMLNALENKFDGRKSQHKANKQTKNEQKVSVLSDAEATITTTTAEITHDNTAEAIK